MIRRHPLQKKLQIKRRPKQLDLAIIQSLRIAACGPDRIVDLVNGEQRKFNDICQASVGS